MTSVKRSALRHPFALAAGGAALVAPLGLNGVAFAVGTDAPWLLGARGFFDKSTEFERLREAIAARAE